jgi:APA family basic amino acid/polyamine antiporter
VGGSALAFYAMIGFEDSVNVAEETKRPSRTFPRALFTGLAIAGTLYLLVALTASYIVPTAGLSGSDAPLLEVVEQGPLDISTRLFAFIALTGALASVALLIDTALDDASVFLRAAILLAVGAALWVVNRLAAQGQP